MAVTKSQLFLETAHTFVIYTCLAFISHKKMPKQCKAKHNLWVTKTRQGYYKVKVI